MSKLMRLHKHASKIINGLIFTLSVVEQWEESSPGFEGLYERVRRSAELSRADCTRIVQICEANFGEDRGWGYVDNDDCAAVQAILDCTKSALAQVRCFQHDVAFLAEHSQVDVRESRRDVAVSFKEHVLDRARRMRDLAKKMLARAETIRNVSPVDLGLTPNTIDLDDPAPSDGDRGILDLSDD